MDEEKLAKQIESYRKLGAEDKKIDVASLMINAIQKPQGNLLPEKQKRWAYFVSFILPPFGLIYVIKFYFSDKDDAQQAAWTCGLLTAISILLTVLFAKALLSGSTATNFNSVNQYKDLLQ